VELMTCQAAISYTAVNFISTWLWPPYAQSGGWVCRISDWPVSCLDSDLLVKWQERATWLTSLWNFIACFRLQSEIVKRGKKAIILQEESFHRKTLSVEETKLMRYWSKEKTIIRIICVV
jgi:hypothetical protein